jgi:cystathionine beta-lyase/cystathionine gamma-synthase
MSIGIEDVDDLWADMFQALDKASELLKARA